MTNQDEILIASDHAGFELKQKLERELENRGLKVRDLGTNSPDSTDYPDYAHPLAKEVSEGHATRGVLICGTGLGMSYVANRYPNVRAAVTWSPEVAELARSHNDANVLVLPARFVDDDTAVKILDKWFSTPFEGGRHVRRVEKIESTAASADMKAEVSAGQNGPEAKAARPRSPHASKRLSSKADKPLSSKAAMPSGPQATKRGRKAAKPSRRKKRGGK